MEKFLYKKSYQLNSFKSIEYDDLWGNKGIFTTIRIIGKNNKFVLLNNHLKKINKSLIKININFFLTDRIIYQLLEPILKNTSINDKLLRIAISKKKISLSVRPRLKIKKNFIGTLFNYQRTHPDIKNLYYKKIIKILKKIDTRNEEVMLFSKKFLLEGCTSNILCIHNNKIYIPNKNFYRGITMNYLLENTNRQIKEDNIRLKDIHRYSEIVLVGSGKGVVKLISIPEINWKSSSDLVYNELSNLYKKIL